MIELHSIHSWGLFWEQSPYKAVPRGTVSMSGKDPNGSAEVAGEASGVTLLECLDNGTISLPGRLNYQQWLKWRSGPGRRPTKARDGRGRTNRMEIDLWAAVMEARFGPTAVAASRVPMTN